MTEPICATSFADARRSRRAISDAWRVLGMANGGSGPLVRYRSGSSRRRPLSSTDFVSSSTNRGTPSVRCTIWSSTSPGSDLPPVRRSISDMVSSRVSRLRVDNVTFEELTQGGSNSGRKVASSSIGKAPVRSMICSSSSRDVGSIHCKSSKIISTGWLFARPSIWSSNAASVRSFFCCGLKLGGAYRSAIGTESSSAMTGICCSGWLAEGSNSASSLAKCSSGLSSRSKWAAPSSCEMNGKRALCWWCGVQK